MHMHGLFVPYAYELSYMCMGSFSCPIFKWVAYICIDIMVETGLGHPGHVLSK